ncbi:MAG TPA: hypothetical protein DHD79_04435 [Firmicutes bacterium]|jgi:hypothetical protein|nr:hypothetical protein [Bacillota bacterium]HAW71449.1 hypothetical protein [Bacillota bacterium]HAZ21331.1 hypothetical protein [Bacillota bacterium]HBE05846.1 hypothetical protein [Bacillota bacterium]HBG43544.1 hypothetical protein [Bacillota bacterium]
MYYTTHLLAGAAVGHLTGNPIMAGVLGLVSHACLDAVPHHDYHNLKPGLVDCTLGTALWFGVLLPVGLPAAVGAIAGAIPDLEVVLKQVFRNWPQIFPSHSGLSPHRRLKLPWGILVQAFTSVISLALILL